MDFGGSYVWTEEPFPALLYLYFSVQLLLCTIVFAVELRKKTTVVAHSLEWIWSMAKMSYTSANSSFYEIMSAIIICIIAAPIVVFVFSVVLFSFSPCFVLSSAGIRIHRIE
jgi:hypothetical protein